MQDGDNKLNVKLNGKDITIDVIDIITSEEYNKEYIFYTIDNLPEDQIFASVLNEKEDSFSLDTIEDEEEYKHVSNLLLELANDKEVSESDE